MGVAGEGEGDGERWGRRVCEAMVNKVVCDTIDESERVRRRRLVGDGAMTCVSLSSDSDAKT